MTTDQEARVASKIIDDHPRGDDAEIVNLTKHRVSWGERKFGIVDLGTTTKGRICELLTFDEIPLVCDLEERAIEMADIAVMSGCPKALIGGPSFLIPILEFYLCHRGIEPVYAHLEKGDNHKWQFVGLVPSLTWEIWNSLEYLGGS